MPLLLLLLLKVLILLFLLFVNLILKSSTYNSKSVAVLTQADTRALSCFGSAIQIFYIYL
jgi:hypothetical protein